MVYICYETVVNLVFSQWEIHGTFLNEMEDECCEVHGNLVGGLEHDFYYRWDDDPID